MPKPVFEFANYRKYLVERLGSPGTRTGLRQKACEAIGCHSTYLSQVLSEKIHLSLEYAEALNEFFEHSSEAAEFFLLLVLRGRSGTKSLSSRFDAQIQEALAARSVIRNRIHDTSEIAPKHRDRFYSNWIYGALHVLVGIKEFQTFDALMRATGLNSKRLSTELEFMLQTGLITESQGRYETGPKMVHLGSESNLVSRHHTNWRFHTIQTLSAAMPTDLHYSAAMSLSSEAAQGVREGLLQLLEKQLKVVESSKEEIAYVYSFDFYQLS